jgi:hypothetical protein
MSKEKQKEEIEKEKNMDVLNIIGAEKIEDTMKMKKGKPCHITFEEYVRKMTSPANGWGQPS